MPRKHHEYIYGINPAFEVLRGGRRTVHLALLNERARGQARMKKLAAFLERKGVPIEWVEKGRVFDFAQSKEHQGVALKTSPYPYAALEELLTRPRLLLLDNVEDPHNVGAVIRCAEVFGFDAVLLPVRGTPEIYPSVVKISAGATEHVAIAREASANQYMQRAREQGYCVIALDAGGTTELRDARTGGRPLLLVIGGEARAVGQFILNSADVVARIPQHGRINSLNASVAAGVAMYHFASTADTAPT